MDNPIKKIENYKKFISLLFLSSLGSIGIFFESFKLSRKIKYINPIIFDLNKLSYILIGIFSFLLVLLLLSFIVTKKDKNNTKIFNVFRMFSIPLGFIMIIMIINFSKKSFVYNYDYFPNVSIGTTILIMIYIIFSLPKIFSGNVYKSKKEKNFKKINNEFYKLKMNFIKSGILSEITLLDDKVLKNYVYRKIFSISNVNNTKKIIVSLILMYLLSFGAMVINFFIIMSNEKLYFLTMVLIAWACVVFLYTFLWMRFIKIAPIKKVFENENGLWLVYLFFESNNLPILKLKNTTLIDLNSKTKFIVVNGDELHVKFLNDNVVEKIKDQEFRKELQQNEKKIFKYGNNLNLFKIVTAIIISIFDNEGI